MHLALANRYDVFRDELYFIVCGRHPAFGYVDQPPLVPLLSAGLYALGHQTWLLRLPPVLAAALLVWLTVRFTRLIGGGDGAAWIAGVAAAVTPMFLGLTATFNTTVFEPLAWTTIAFGLTRFVLRDDRRAPVWAGIVAGLALEAKYAGGAWLIALAIGFALTPGRRIFGRRELWLGAALAIVIAIPSVLWQAAHGWPFVELVRAAGSKNVAVSPMSFMLNQVFVMHPLFAPLWIAGIVAPFAMRDLARVRALAIAFVAVMALTIAGHGKDYYVAAAYPTVFAIGAVAWARIVRSAAVRNAYLIAAVVLAAIIAPLAVPVLAPSAIEPYEHALHLGVQAQEKDERGARVPQTFADQLGWRDFVREVGTAYASLPADLRGRTSIVVGNYGEAGALEIYGEPYGLPLPLSGHNSYFLWGLRGQQPENVMVVQHDLSRLRTRCDDVRVLGTTSSPLAMPYENGLSIAFCRRLHPALAEVWPQLKNYQ